MSKIKTNGNSYDIVLIIGPNQDKHYAYLKEQCEQSGLNYCIIGDGKRTITLKEITETLNNKIHANTDIEVLVHGRVDNEHQGSGIYRTVHKLELSTIRPPEPTSLLLSKLKSCAPDEVLCPILSSCGSAQAKTSVPQGMEAVFLSESTNKTINAISVEGITARIEFLKSNKEKNIQEALVQSSTLIPEDFIFSKQSLTRPFQLNYSKEPSTIDFVQHLAEREIQLRKNIIGEDVSTLTIQEGITLEKIQRYKDLSLMLALSRAGSSVPTRVAQVNEVRLENEIKLVKDYVQSGADVNASLMDGTTPLHMAFGFAIDAHGTRGIKGLKDMDLTLLEYLVENGAKLHVLDETKRKMCFSAACIQGNSRLVSKLIESGEDINQTFSNGASPLISAVVNGNTEVVAELLAHDGIDLEKTYKGKTAIEWANKKGNTTITEMIAHQSAKGHSFEVVEEKDHIETNVRARRSERMRERTERDPGHIISDGILAKVVQYYCASSENKKVEKLVISAPSVTRIKRALGDIMNTEDFSVQRLGRTPEGASQFLIKVTNEGINKLNTNKEALGKGDGKRL